MSRPCGMPVTSQLSEISSCGSHRGSDMALHDKAPPMSSVQTGSTAVCESHRCQTSNLNAVHLGRQSCQTPPRPPLLKGGWGDLLERDINAETYVNGVGVNRPERTTR